MQPVAWMQPFKLAQCGGANQCFGIKQRCANRLRRYLRWRHGQKQDRCRAQYCRMCGVGRNHGEQGISTRSAFTPCGNSQRGMRIIMPLWSKPFMDLLRRPGLRTIHMAGCAAIRCCDLRRYIRARDTKGVIPPPVDAHISHPRHMAGNTLRALRSSWVAMVFGRVKTRRQMALRADGISFRA